VVSQNVIPSKRHHRIIAPFDFRENVNFNGIKSNTLKFGGDNLLLPKQSKERKLNFRICKYEIIADSFKSITLTEEVLVRNTHFSLFSQYISLFYNRISKISTFAIQSRGKI